MSNTRKTFHRDQSKCAPCDTKVTRFPYNHRLSPLRLLIAVSLSLLPQRGGGEEEERGAEGSYASRRSARITADYADKIARYISRAHKRCVYTQGVSECPRDIIKINSVIKFYEMFQELLLPK